MVNISIIDQMIEKLSPTAKVSISSFSVLVIATSVFISAVYMRDIMYPYMDTGGSTEGVVAGVSTDSTKTADTGSFEKVPTAEARIEIDDNGAGSAVLYLNLDSFARVAGLDLSFAVSGDLEVLGVSCAEEYECVSTVASDDSLRLILYRPPNVAGELWTGRSEMATLSYTMGTSGELEMNGGEIRVSEVVEVATARNLLPDVTRSYMVGQ